MPDRRRKPVRLAVSAALDMLPATVMAELRARYAEPHRAYHDWSHIEALLDLAKAAAPAEPAAFRLAILFHDAVYDPRATDNERRSAELLRARAANLNPACVDRAAALILATEKHLMPDTDDSTLRSDAALFLDMDLSILGAEPDRFDRYDAAIRREYAHVPDDAYRAGRTAALTRFLERPRIFLTDPFSDRLEAPARANLRRALDRLAEPGVTPASG